MRNDVLFVQDNILVVQFYGFALLRVRALFFVRLTVAHYAEG